VALSVAGLKLNSNTRDGLFYFFIVFPCLIASLIVMLIQGCILHDIKKAFEHNLSEINDESTNRLV
jgi:hypothetical protein